jgi:hypothetical protein
MVEISCNMFYGRDNGAHSGAILHRYAMVHHIVSAFVTSIIEMKGYLVNNIHYYTIYHLHVPNNEKVSYKDDFPNAPKRQSLPT